MCARERSTMSWPRKIRMNIEMIEYINTDYADELISRLRGSVFHLTCQHSFNCILEDNRIRHNKDGRLPVYPGSESGFGRKKGWVPFFDFRCTTNEVIEKTIERYYFLGPSWFKSYHPDFSESKLAYLFLSEHGVNDLIPNSHARKILKESVDYEQYIPDTECWFPGEVSLNLIAKVLLVRIFNDAPKNNLLLYAQNLQLVDSQVLK